MKTVKVEMLSDEVNRAGDPLEKDSIQDMTEDSAKHWIKRQKAKLVQEPKKGKAAAPGDKSPEQKAAEEKVAADAEAKRVADELVAADQKAKDDAAAKAAGAGSQQQLK